MELDLPPQLQHLSSQGISKCISLNQISLGTSILYSIIISKSSIPQYHYITQFLKTKFLQSKQKDYQEFNKFYIHDQSVLTDQSFLNFLNNFGEFIISSKSTIYDTVLFETLSRDLNIRLKIFISGVLAIETSSYELVPAVPVILNLPNSQSPSIVEYLLFDDQPSLNLFTIHLAAQNLNLVQEFSSKLADAYKTIPTSKTLKAWAENIKEKLKSSKNFEIIRKILQAKRSIQISKDLKTSNRSIESLKIFGFNYNEETKFLKTFAPISEIGALREPLKPYQFTEEQLREMEKYERDSSSESEESMRRKIVVCNEPTNEPIEFDDEPEGDEGEEEEEEGEVGNYPDAGLAESRDQAYNPQPKGPGGAHCQKCSSEPTDLSISCGCRLSFECMQLSLVQRTCVGCSKQVSEEDFAKLRIYFEL